MQFDEPLEIDFRPAVPATVRAKLNSVLRSTTRFVVDSVPTPGKTAKINAIRVTNKPGQFPKESVDEIAEAITAIMHVAWAEQETEDPDIGLPPMEFVITSEYKDGKSRQRSQFTYVYKGDDVPDYVEDTMSIEDRAVLRILELQERSIVNLQGNISEYMDKFLQIVQQNTAQAAAGSRVFDQAMPMFFAAVQARLDANHQENSAKRVEAKERAATERMTVALQTVAPFIGMGLQQFLANKLGIPIVPPGHAQPTNGHAHAPPSDDDDDDGSVNPLAEMARFFGDGLSVEQRRELNRILTKKQQACFDDLFCSATDADAIAAYAQVATHALDKLGALQQLLSMEQGQVLGAFMQAVSTYQPSAPPA